MIKKCESGKISEEGAECLCEAIKCYFQEEAEE
jgi:hypothetical protein